MKAVIPVTSVGCQLFVIRFDTGVAQAHGLKAKAIPGQALRVPEVEAPRFLDNTHMKVVIPTHRPPLPPRKFSWLSFLLEAESTPGP